MKAKVAFIPISLGNHYYDSDVLGFIRKLINDEYDINYLLICDRLRFLSYRIRGQQDNQALHDKVDSEVAQFGRTLANAEIGGGRVKVITWAFASDDPRYRKIVAELAALLQRDDSVSAYLTTLTNKLVSKHAQQAPSGNTTELQTSYIIEETAISLFMTEVIGANHEVYKQESEGLIKYLYQHHTDWLGQLLGKTELDRRFISLNRLIPKQVGG